MESSFSRNELLKTRWENLTQQLTDQFSDGAEIDIEGILYLIGVQELGQLHKRFKKDDNVNLIHIGICTVLEPLGFYAFDYYDLEGWPHFKLLEPLPSLKPGEQSLMMKEAIVDYFIEKEVIQ